MKIAVTYDKGEIFQHFGKTESFKVYEVEANKVVSSEVIGSNGTGHGALAGLLAEQGVNVLICGGIGGGAQTALTEAGIKLCSVIESSSIMCAAGFSYITSCKLWLRSATSTASATTAYRTKCRKNLPHTL